jgi:PAS domain S-box-containing protein
MFIVVALIPMFVVALLSYQRARIGLVNLALSKVEQEASLTAKDTETFLEQFSADIVALSQSPPVQGIIRARDTNGIDPISGDSYEAGIDQLRQIFASIVSSKKFYRSLFFMDEEGNELVRVEYELGKVTIVSMDTRLGVRDALPVRQNTEADFFLNAQSLNDEHVYTTELILDQLDGEIRFPNIPIIQFSTPIYDSGKQFRGVIVSTVYAASFLDRLIVDKGQIYLANQEGYYLYHPDKSQAFGAELGIDANAQNDFPTAKQFLADPDNDVYTFLDDERSEVIALRKLHFDPEKPERYWILIRTLPQEIVLEQVNDLDNLVLGLAIIVMALVILAALWLARSFTKPIIQLKNTANLISQQDLPQLVESLRQVAAGEVVDKLNLSTQRIPVKSQDELGQLGTAFNEMSSSLQEQNERIQQVAAGLHETNLDLKRLANQLEVASDVARDATAAENLSELLDRAVYLIRDRFGYYHAGIFLVDRRGEYAVLRSAVGEIGKKMLADAYQLALNEKTILGSVISTGEIVVTPGSDTNDTVNVNDSWLPGTQSEIILPLRLGEKIIGALDVQSDKENAFNEDDVRVLQIMADQLAVALEKTRLFERTQAALEERLQTIISNAPVFLLAMDRKGVFTLAEGQGLRSIGIKAKNVIGRQASELWREIPNFQDDRARALKGDAFVSLLEMGDMVFETNWTPLFDRYGNLNSVTIVATDITERKRAEDKLKHNAELLRGLSIQLAEAEEIERQRIARELHDQVGQNLTALGINLNIVKSQLLNESEFTRARLDDSLDLIVETTERIRAVMADLRSPVLDDYGLLKALRWHGQQFGSRTGIDVTVKGVEFTQSLDSRLESALFRIAQEALNNIAKHAQATKVDLILTEDKECVRMSVMDDGIGFDMARPAETGKQRGWGLLIMSERAESVGGSFEIESFPGQGTRVTVKVER